MKLMLGDCLELMKTIPTGSVSMVLCDLPYGTTAAPWDSVIPLPPLWEQYLRICKGAIVLSAAQPFTSALVMSNISKFRHVWIWEKSKASNFFKARKQPLKAHEDILVFSKDRVPYFPQMTDGEPYKGRTKKGSQTVLLNNVPNPTFRNDNLTGKRFPRSVQYFVTAENEGTFHPTQKPVALMEYMIRTYTNAGDTVLDNTMGSGTTGVACANTGRDFIGIERDPEYFAIAEKRIREAELNNL